MFYALSAVIGPFVGQNIAACKPDRIYQALKLCTIFCVGSGLIIAAMLAALSSFLPGMFSENNAVTETARLFLLIAPISYGAYGVVMVMNASFNGMGKPMPAVFISVARMAVLYVPLAIVMQAWFGIAGIFGTYAFANIASAVVAYYWARNSVQAQCDKHEAPILVSETG
jgi:Na+-driven multidrug efflux pump